MYMSEKDFANIMRNNPSLKIARSNPCKTSLTTESPEAPTLNEEKAICKGTKYRNFKVYVYEDGYVHRQSGNKAPKLPGHGRCIEKYDSVKEYNRCLELRKMSDLGIISKLQRQVKFTLQPSFERDGKIHRAIIYTADFCYTDNAGRNIVEDVKGLDKESGKIITTKEFDLKWKILQYQHPELSFHIEAL